MRKIKFRLRLEDKITKEIIVTYAELYNPKYSSDLMQYPINLKEFNVLSIDEYTGLRDKNRMEIYEGDILSCDDIFPSRGVQKYVVEYYNGSYHATPIDKVKRSYLLLQNITDNSLLVGNKYDNGDLIHI